MRKSRTTINFRMKMKRFPVCVVLLHAEVSSTKSFDKLYIFVYNCEISRSLCKNGDFLFFGMHH